MPALPRTYYDTGSAVLDALTGEEIAPYADYGRMAAQFIDPLGVPSLPGDVPVYHTVRGVVDKADPLVPFSTSARERAAAIRTGGFPEYGKTFFTPDYYNRAIPMLPETGPGGLGYVDPEEFIFEGKISGDQFAKGARYSTTVGELEGLFEPSVANQVFGVGDVPQTTTGKTIPVNRFLGVDLDSLLGKSRRAVEALKNIPGMKSASDILADPALAKHIGSKKAVAAAKILGGAARFAPWVSAPLGALATVGHARDIAEANEMGDTFQALSSTVKAGLAGASSIPVVGIAPYLAELGLEGVEEIRNRFFPFDAEKEAAATMGYMKPEEFGLDPFTNEQIQEARATFQRLMEETPEEVSQYISPTADPYIYQDQIAEALRNAQAEQTLFTGDEVDVASRAPVNLAEILRSVEPPPTWFPPTTSSGSAMVTDPTPTVEPSPFIGDEGFTPSLDARTLGGPVVGTTQTGVPSGFEALASLIQDDPSVAQKYISGAGPTAELANLVANTGVETFTDIPETPWTPPAPVVPDITEELVDFSAIQSSREAEAQKAQDKIDRQLEHAANVRRKDEEKARLASARNAKSEQARINKENKERKAEEKRIADKQAAEEKQRRAIEVQMADMLKQMNETHQAYLARKREEEARRKRLGYGVGAMYT